MQLYRKWAFLIASTVLLGACRDRTYAIPVTTCSSFSFVAATDAEAVLARKLMYASAIEFGLRFEDNSFGTSGPRAEILWSSDRGDRLVLAGHRYSTADQTSYSVLYLIGGVDNYRHPTASCGATPKQFEHLREIFSEEWDLRDIKTSSVLPNSSCMDSSVKQVCRS